MGIGTSDQLQFLVEACDFNGRYTAMCGTDTVKHNADAHIYTAFNRNQRYLLRLR
jgi:hypothetical protein